MAKTDFQSIDEFIASRPDEERDVLERIRAAIRAGAPEAEEVISYQLPAFRYQGFVMYFGAATKHYSLSFPPPWTVFDQFAGELAEFKVSKSTIQLPKNRPVPYDLITRMAAFRAAENAAAVAAKK